MRDSHSAGGVLLKKLKYFEVITAQKMKFSMKDLFGKQEKILNGKLHLLCSVY